VGFVVVGCVLAVAGFVVLDAGVGGAVVVGVVAAGAGAVAGLTAVGVKVSGGVLGTGAGCAGKIKPGGEIGDSTALVAACSMRILPPALTFSAMLPPARGAKKELVAACSMSSRGLTPAVERTDSGELATKTSDEVAE
jgi:hypothetical protein